MVKGVAFWCLVAFMMVGCAASVVSRGMCTNSKSKAYVTAMKSDLRNLVAAQAAYRAEHGRYATNAILQSGALAVHYRSSTGVQLTIIAAEGRGWRAIASHQGLKDATCTMDSAAERASCVLPADRVAVYSDLLLARPDVWLFALTFAFRRRAIARASKEPAPAA
jgi:type II secretory pathway pseudopilin PulG